MNVSPDFLRKAFGLITAENPEDLIGRKVRIDGGGFAFRHELVTAITGVEAFMPEPGLIELRLQVAASRFQNDQLFFLSYDAAGERWYVYVELPGTEYPRKPVKIAFLSKEGKDGGPS